MTCSQEGGMRASVRHPLFDRRGPGPTRERFRARPRVEQLEVRAVPAVAFTPAQVVHAYGFDKVTFSSGGVAVPADGAGQTIAIVDAYDDPTAQADLDAFSQKYGLPLTTGGQFTFAKLNQTGGTTMPAANKSWATEI